MNTLEFKSLLCLICFLYTGMFFVTGANYSYMDAESGNHLYFMPFIALTTIGFFIYWVYYLIKSLVHCWRHDRKKVTSDETPGQKKFGEKHNDQSFSMLDKRNRFYNRMEDLKKEEVRANQELSSVTDKMIRKLFPKIEVEDNEDMVMNKDFRKLKDKAYETYFNH